MHCVASDQRQKPEGGGGGFVIIVLRDLVFWLCDNTVFLYTGVFN